MPRWAERRSEAANGRISWQPVEQNPVRSVYAKADTMTATSTTTAIEAATSARLRRRGSFGAPSLRSCVTFDRDRPDEGGEPPWG
jgi:hypothetical protein